MEKAAQVEFAFGPPKKNQPHLIMNVRRAARPPPHARYTFHTPLWRTCRYEKMADGFKREREAQRAQVRADIVGGRRDFAARTTALSLPPPVPPPLQGNMAHELLLLPPSASPPPVHPKTARRACRQPSQVSRSLTAPAHATTSIVASAALGLTTVPSRTP